MKRVYQITTEDLKSIRGETGLDTEEFATRLGLTRNSVQKYEKGDALPSLYVLARMAKEFNVTFEISPEWTHRLLTKKASD